MNPLEQILQNLESGDVNLDRMKRYGVCFDHDEALARLLEVCQVQQHALKNLVNLIQDKPNEPQGKTTKP